MPIWTTGSISSTKTTGQVSKSRVTTVTLSANGLLPNSSYTFWCNGVNMTWACRNPGSRMGAGLFSDQYGSMTVLFSAELTPNYGPTSESSVKYNSMQLKDINGGIHSIGITSQALIGK